MQFNLEAHEQSLDTFIATLETTITALQVSIPHKLLAFFSSPILFCCLVYIANKQMEAEEKRKTGKACYASSHE